MPFFASRLLEEVNKHILLILIASMASACGPHIGQYEYISLEDVPEIEVLLHGRTERDDVFLQSKMPIRYRLIRDDYLLYFEVNTEFHSGVLNARAEQSTGEALYIHGEEYPGSCATFHPYYDSELVVMDEEKNAVTFSWGKNFEYCRERTYDPHKQVLAFRVEGKDGEVLGNERLVFRLVENGIVVRIDAV